MEEKFVMTCDKDSVYLSRDKSKHMYLIEFRACNPKIRIDALLTFDIYKMMYELNKDLFDSYHIAYPDPADPSRAELLFIFKSIMGLGERYTHVCTDMPHLLNQNQNQNQPPQTQDQYQSQIIHISSTNVPKTGTATLLLKHLIPKRAEQIDSDNSNITIHVQPDGHVIHFHYKFKLQMSKPDDVLPIPPFVDKAIGTMMKTIFVRMKQFIECLG
jgi:hypothetical protein